MEINNITGINGFAFRGHNYKQISFPDLDNLNGEENFSNNNALIKIDFGNVNNLTDKLLNDCNNLSKIFLKNRKKIKGKDSGEITNLISSTITNSANVKIYVRNVDIEEILKNNPDVFINNHLPDNIIYQKIFYTSECETPEDLINIINGTTPNYFKIIDDGDKLKNWLSDVNFKNSVEELEELDLTQSTIDAIPEKYFENSKLKIIKFPKSVTTFGNNVFNNTENLHIIELRQETETDFSATPSVNSYKNIKILVNNELDYQKLKNDKTIFVNPHNTNYIKYNLYIVPRENYSIEEITKVLTEETEYNGIIDEFNVIGELMFNNYIPKINIFPNNIKILNFDRIKHNVYSPLFNLTDWNNIEELTIGGKNLSIHSFENSKIISIDLSKSTLYDNIIPDNFCKNCYYLETFIINERINEIKESAFSGCNTPKIFIKNLETVYYTKETDTINDIANIINYSGFYETIYDGYGIITNSGKTLSEISAQKDAALTGLVLTNLSTVSAHNLFGNTFNENYERLTLIGSGSLPNFINNQYIKYLNLDKFYCVEIQENCFSGCSNLETLIFGDSIQILKNNAFAGCDKLKNIEIMTESDVYTEGTSGLTGSRYIICYSNNTEQLKSYFPSESFDFIQNELVIKLVGEQTNPINIDTISNGQRFILDASECTGDLQIERIDDLSENDLIIEAIIGENVTSLSNGAFARCIKLKKFDSYLYPVQVCKDCYSLDNLIINPKNNKIYYEAFENCYSLSNVEIKEGVERIFERAFYKCHGMKTLKIPESVIFIGPGAFSECYNLEYVECLISEPLMFYSHTGAKVERSNLKLKNNISSDLEKEFVNMFCFVQIEEDNTIVVNTDNIIDFSKFYPEKVILNISTIDNLISYDFGTGNLRYQLKELNFTSTNSFNIPDNFFANCYNLEKLTIPSSCISLGKDCFKNCFGLRHVDCQMLTNDGFYSPTSAYTIDLKLNPNATDDVKNKFNTMFNFHNMTGDAETQTIYYSGENPIIRFNVNYYGNIILEPDIENQPYGKISWSGSKTAGNLKLRLKKVIIGNRINDLQSEIFKDCYRLETVLMYVNFPMSFPDNAFKNCYSLFNCAPYSMITSFGNYCFENCFSLTKVGNGMSDVTIIGKSSFKNCYNLRVDDYIKCAVNNSSFENCKSISKIKIAQKIIPNYCFKNCCSITSLNNIIDDCDWLDTSAFENCVSIKEAVINSDVYSNCFKNCQSLQTLTLKDNTKYLGESAFENCHALDNVIIKTNENYGEFTPCGSKVNNLNIYSEDKIVRDGYEKMFSDNDNYTTIYYGGQNPRIDFTKNYKNKICLEPDPNNPPTGTLNVSDKTGNLTHKLNKLILDGITDITLTTFENCFNIEEVIIKSNINFNRTTPYGCNVSKLILPYQMPNAETVKTIFGAKDYTELIYYTSNLIYLLDKTFSHKFILLPDKTKTFSGIFTLSRDTTQPDKIANNLEYLEIANGITKISDNSLNYLNCKIKLPNTLENIGNEINYLNTNYIEIPYGLNDYPHRIDNTKLKFINIPNSLESYTGHNFSNNSCLKYTRQPKLNYNASMSVISGVKFNNLPIIDKIIYPTMNNGILALATSEISNCYNLKELIITADKMTFTCENNGFINCDKLETIECLITSGFVKNDSSLEDGLIKRLLINSSTDDEINNDIIEAFGCTNNPEHVYEVVYYSSINPVIINKTYSHKVILRPSKEYPPSGKLTISGNGNFQEQLVEAYISGINEIGANTFTDCVNLTKIEFEDEKIEKIGTGAFNNCHYLKNIDLPKSVNTIGYDAFNNCYSLEKIKLSNITSLEPDLFTNCYCLNNIEFSNSITNIPFMAFYRNYNLKKIILPNTIKTIEGNAFSSNYNLQKITIPNSVEKIYAWSFSDCVNLQNLIIPSSITIIENQAFNNCYNLKNVICLFDDSIIIEEEQTPNCSVSHLEMPNITDENLKNKLKTIFGYVEEGSEIIYYNPEDFNTEEGLDLTGNYNKDIILKPALNKSFVGKKFNIKKGEEILTRLINVEIADGFIEIGNNAFSECYCLKNVKIPNTITKIGENAFEQCFGLNNVEIPDSVTEISSNCFTYCVALENIKLSNSLTKIGEKAFMNCYSLNNVEIPDSVIEILDYCFAACYALENIKLSNRLRDINDGLFENCLSLHKITIPKSVTSFSTSSFTNCKIEELILAHDIEETIKETIIQTLSPTKIIGEIYYSGENPTLDSGEIYKYGCIVKEDPINKASGKLRIISDNLKEKLIELDLSGINEISQILIDLPRLEKIKIFDSLTSNSVIPDEFRGYATDFILPDSMEIDEYKILLPNAYNAKNYITSKNTTYICEPKNLYNDFNFIIPDNEIDKKIPVNALSDCYNLKNIYIPKCVKEFDLSALKNCVNLDNTICLSTCDLTTDLETTKTLTKSLTLNIDSEYKDKYIAKFGNPDNIIEILFYGGENPTIDYDKNSVGNKIYILPDPDNPPYGSLSGTGNNIKNKIVYFEIPETINHINIYTFNGLNNLQFVKCLDPTVIPLLDVAGCLAKKLIINHNADNETINNLIRIFNPVIYSFELPISAKIDGSKVYNKEVHLVNQINKLDTVEMFGTGGNIKSYLKSIKLDNIGTIKEGTFKNCLNLDYLEIGENIEIIEEEVFNNVITKTTKYFALDAKIPEKFKNFKTDKLILNIRLKDNDKQVETIKKMFNYTGDVLFEQYEEKLFERYGDF